VRRESQKKKGTPKSLLEGKKKNFLVGEKKAFVNKEKKKGGGGETGKKNLFFLEKKKGSNHPGVGKIKGTAKRKGGGYKVEQRLSTIVHLRGKKDPRLHGGGGKRKRDLE